jgi:hypothetical protein
MNGPCSRKNLVTLSFPFPFIGTALAWKGRPASEAYTLTICFILSQSRSSKDQGDFF